ncbi:hypothetical protein [Nocardioides sp. Leaf285]|uniref:hypothetical protein n=1 Tax=Nocardioides sp. Leaf285 TaxID=1736322 RepID=UPI000702A95B|nr:hypothetical protein [Nocardioides sp. Leaf285]KQP63165.1 hypothetical protein ASF47_19335 [Nocardioides sp. Leaf285]
MAPRPEREKTIAANGAIIDKPYGPSRWASPRRTPCPHPQCSKAARILARADSHPIDGPDGPTRKAHNCCGQH